MDIVDRETGQRMTKVRAYRFTLPHVAAGSKIWLRVWANNQVGNLVFLEVKVGVVNDAGNFDLGKGNYYAGKPSLTPDGKYVVGQGGIMSVAESESPIVPGQMTSVVGGADNICVYDLATGAVVAMFEPTRVKGENACFPVVAPDGRRVALCWGPACMESLAIVSLADLVASRPRPQVLYQGQRHLMQATLEATSTPAWSPDGRVVAFARSFMTTTTVSSNLAIIGADGSGARQLTSFGVDTICTAPCFSPDGRRIAFTVLTGKHGPIRPEHLATLRFTADIWVIGADGSGLARLTDDGISCEPAWCR
jgi:Tol biopolymer transport system component